MDYAEAAYFDGYHFKHVAAWVDHKIEMRRQAEMARLARSYRR